ncbi:MAG: hypothetical protein KJ970_17035 [Candidatus Eisenbacteria bacterium]|uniref:PglD N-terminal domain-containing protein n=1 Tax=Eiseniibacteriota bacterium TaxID=2212470 RepID=A0A948S0K0_UNCEI|nr:hypothetical protein [Candidatus Eisenbacteria bacterium]MBU1949040.1 hypothetical protein [Candidatus Eisenbacteria bacterium]MBU2692622.1 hypothetical protein [Candidatus Eisenbacteria bacterium]
MKFVVIGAGQTGRMVGEFMRRQTQLECIGYLDDNADLHGRIFYNLSVIGGTDRLESLREGGLEGALPVLGNMAARRRLFKKVKDLGFKIPSVIDPSVNLCSDVELGEGAVISLGTNILTGVHIGPYAQIGTGVSIGHDITIGTNCVIGGNTIVGASAKIGDNFFAGTGVNIAAGSKTIGNNVFLCAGSVIFKDIPDNAVVLGNPGRVIRYQDPLKAVL